ncbi:hypothetical protein BGP77_12070 [Saccharospirillum sp. MSK14-1]|uniref:hypothetical protein n=1 Tax=Saccharospirillum sp. MSK14-1 TaxID=1897632 RepID=UPI000D34BBC1|nr:hypothetical protein [Saccharospirillum sp. MSK14-1]PTY38441.1 hypothetical protein BGP77_12070 [Saccharospirillum sp. MSK14-1]
MSDITVQVIHFEQQLTLPKSEFELVDHDGLRLTLKHASGQYCQPGLYYRPLNANNEKLGDYSLHEFQMLLFECYEGGHTPVAWRDVREEDDHLMIQSRYQIRHDDEQGQLSGLTFSYHQEDDVVYHYRVENALHTIELPSFDLPPLEIPVTGELTSRVEHVTLGELV